MKRVLIGAIAVLVCLLLAATFSCKIGAKSATPGNLSDDETAAWVNGKQIPKKMVDDIISSMPPMYQAQVKTPQGMKNLLENVVAVELVYDKAMKDGFLNKPDVQEKIQNVTKQVVYAAYIEDAMKANAADDAALKKYYEENKAQFSTKDQVQASHVLFKLAADGSDDAAKKKACEALLPKAKAADADFAALAKQFSDDPSKGNGGDLGFFEKERMVKPFADAAFAMKVGEVNGCVKSRFGYHIIKKTGEKPAAEKPFEEVKTQVAEAMKHQTQQKTYEDILNKLKEGANIKYNEKAFGITAEAQPPMPGMPGAPQGGQPPAPPAPSKAP